MPDVILSGTLFRGVLFRWKCIPGTSIDKNILYNSRCHYTEELFCIFEYCQFYICKNGQSLMRESGAFVTEFSRGFSGFAFEHPVEGTEALKADTIGYLNDLFITFSEPG